MLKSFLPAKAWARQERQTPHWLPTGIADGTASDNPARPEASATTVTAMFFGAVATVQSVWDQARTAVVGDDPSPEPPLPDSLGPVTRVRRRPLRPEDEAARDAWWRLRLPPITSQTAAVLARLDLDAEAVIRPVSLDAAENALHFIARCERAGLPELAAPARGTLARELAARDGALGDPLRHGPQDFDPACEARMLRLYGTAAEDRARLLRYQDGLDQIAAARRRPARASGDRRYIFRDPPTVLIPAP